jgi:hypothetical protein
MLKPETGRALSRLINRVLERLKCEGSYHETFICHVLYNLPEDTPDLNVRWLLKTEVQSRLVDRYGIPFSTYNGWLCDLHPMAEGCWSPVAAYEGRKAWLEDLRREFLGLPSEPSDYPYPPRSERVTGVQHEGV